MQSKLCQPRLFSATPVAKLIIMLGTARMDLAPQGLTEGEAGTSPEGALAAQTEEIRADWCTIGA